MLSRSIYFLLLVHFIYQFRILFEQKHNLVINISYHHHLFILQNDTLYQVTSFIFPTLFQQYFYHFNYQFQILSSQYQTTNQFFMNLSRFKQSLKRTRQDMTTLPTDNYFKTVRFRQDQHAKQNRNNQYTMDVLSTIKSNNKMTNYDNFKSSQFTQNEKNKLLKKQKDNQIESNYIQIINEIIEKDKAKVNKKTTSTNYNSQSNYLVNKNILIPIDCHPIPSILYQLYQQRQSQRLQVQGNMLNITKGFLPKSGYLYYTVEKIAVFIKWSQLLTRKLQKKRNIQYCIVELDDVIMTIQQTEIHPQNICSSLRNNVILVSYPWRVALYAYYCDKIIKHQQNQQITSNSQQINLLDLGIRLDLHCETVKKFETSIQNSLIYADNNGKINIIKLQDQYQGGFLKNGKYSLRNYKLSAYPIFRQNNLKMMRRQKTIFQKLMFLVKNMQVSISRLFPDRSKPLNICYHKQSEYVFTLLENRKLQRTLQFYANEVYFTLIKRQKKKQFKLIHSKTEQEIFQICHHFLMIQRQQFQIQSISSLSSKIYQESNLCILLKNGTKIYLQVTPERIIYMQSWFPPDRNNLTDVTQQLKQKNKTSLQKSKISNMRMTNYNQKNTVHKNRRRYNPVEKYSKQQDKFIIGKQSNEIKVVGHNSIGTKNYMIYQANKGIYSFTTKYNHIKETQEICQINWWQNFSKKQFRVAKQIKFFYRNGREIKKQCPKFLEDQQNQQQQPIEVNIMRTVQNEFFHTNDTQFICSSMKNIPIANQQLIYELSRQTHYLPVFTIYTSEQVLSIAINLRPIDIIFTLLMIVDNEILSMELMTKLLGINENPYNSKQIIAMLIQIYTDIQGVYYYCQQIGNSDPKLFEILKNKKRQCFDPEIDQIGKRIHENMLNSFSKGLFKAYHYHNLTNSIKIKIINLSYRISENLQYNSQDDTTANKGTFYQLYNSENIINESIFLYLGRVLSLIWYEKITIISIDLARSFLTKFINIRRFIIEFQPFRDKQANILGQMHPLHFIDYLAQVFRFIIQLSPRIPQIILSECLSKPVQFFQRYIFLKIRFDMNSNIITKWQSQFPKFISRNLKHLIGIYDKVNQLQSQYINNDTQGQDSFQNVILLLLKKQRDAYPAYFLKYLVEEVGIVGAKGLRRQKMFTIQTKYEHPLIDIANNMKLAHYLNKSQYLKEIHKLVLQILETVQKQQNTIDHKLFLLRTAQEKLIPELQKYHQKSIIGNQQKQQLKESLNYFQLKLRFQQYILDGYHQIIAESCIKEQLEYKLTNTTFQDQQLFELSKKLGNQKLLCVFLCMFKRAHGARAIIEKILQSYNAANTAIAQFKQFLQKNLGEIVWKSNYKLPCQIIIQSVQKYLLLFHHDTQSLCQGILTFNQKTHIDSQQFWLPNFLKSLGYNYEDIFKGFYHIMENKILEYFKYEKENQLVDEKEILLTWINCLIFVVSSYDIGRNKFIEITNNIIKEGRKGTGQLLLSQELSVGMKNILYNIKIEQN